MLQEIHEKVPYKTNFYERMVTITTVHGVLRTECNKYRPTAPWLDIAQSCLAEATKFRDSARTAMERGHKDTADQLSYAAIALLEAARELITNFPPAEKYGQ